MDWPGRTETVDYLIRYHQRLQTNLTYLATMADAATKDAPVPTQQIDLSPVVYPPGLAHLQPSKQSEFVKLISCSAGQTRAEVVAKTTPPVMLQDPIGNSKPDPSTYRAAPPFATPNEPIPGFIKLEDSEARDQVVKSVNTKAEDA
jgi:hypothetical protein